MPLCGLHDHVICAKHYLFGQAKPGLPEFADELSLVLHIAVICFFMYRNLLRVAHESRMEA